MFQKPCSLPEKEIGKCFNDITIGLVNSFLVRGDFSYLLKTFVNSLDPYQDGQNVGLALESNHLTL